MRPRRIFVSVLAVAAGASVVLAAARSRSESYPDSTVTLIVAFVPGGITDTVARLIAGGLSERLQQRVAVENRAGGGGNIGASYVARAEPDGRTLLVTTTAFAIDETLSESTPFRPGDFKPVAIAAYSAEVLATSPTNPANDLAVFIEQGRGRVIRFGSAGVGTGSHIAAAYFFKVLANVSARHIPFQGGAPAIDAVIGGQVDLVSATLAGGAAVRIAEGALKGLGVAAAKRAAVAPNVPTFAEQGYPGFIAGSWVGFFAPAETDPQIVATLNRAINETIQMPKIQQRLVAVGFDPIVGSPAEADAMVKADVDKWGIMVKALGMPVR